MRKGQHSWDDVEDEHQAFYANTIRRQKSTILRVGRGGKKSDLSIYNVHIEDIMDESTRSVATIVLSNIQNGYTKEDTRRLNARFPVAPAEVSLCVCRFACASLKLNRASSCGSQRRQTTADSEARPSGDAKKPKPWVVPPCTPTQFT
eukprot:6481564-Amphidinium_carterae.1